MLEKANIIDQEGYKDKFLSLVVPKTEKYGLKFLARGGKSGYATVTLLRVCNSGGACRSAGVLPQQTYTESGGVLWRERNLMR